MGGMRGTPERQLSMLSSLSTEDLIPAEHPIRRIRVVVDTVLADLDVNRPVFCIRSSEILRGFGDASKEGLHA